MEEGRITNLSNSYTYEYHLKDHLGNVRVAFSPGGSSANTLQVNEYYPFGSSFLPVSPENDNKLKFGDKEIQDDIVGGSLLNYYDFIGRTFDPVVPHFLQIDPLAEISRRWSTYTYCYNNPMRFIDPDGMQVIGVPAEEEVFKKEELDLEAANREQARRALSNEKPVEEDVRTAINRTPEEQAEAFAKGNSGGSIDFTRPITEQVPEGFLLPKTETENNETKNVPNPNGRAGSQEHQDKIGEVVKGMKDQGMKNIRTEAKIGTPGGTKPYRYADVVGTNPETGAKEYVNVGRQNQNGTPVSREFKALIDIKNNVAPQDAVRFVPYVRLIIRR